MLACSGKRERERELKGKVRNEAKSKRAPERVGLVDHFKEFGFSELDDKPLKDFTQRNDMALLPF